MAREIAPQLVEYGKNKGDGNLIGIQPYMRTADYQSEEAFEQRLRVYFDQVADAGWISQRTVAVLPEHIGTWLVAAGESRAVYRASDSITAMRHLVLHHVPAFIRAFFRTREIDRTTAALFRMKSAEMARIYQAVFSRLAKYYRTTIAAGSILVESPRVIDGKIQSGQGSLYNTAFVFHADGTVDRLISAKIFPVESELPFVSCASIKDLPVFQTPAGMMAVVVCADSWYPEVYEHLNQHKVDIVVIPSAILPGSSWEQLWRGYSGFPAPKDVALKDVGHLTERQAWRKYAMLGRLAASGSRIGMNIFLYGELWDLEFGGGQWRIVFDDQDIESNNQGPALINLWL